MSGGTTIAELAQDAATVAKLRRWYERGLDTGEIAERLAVSRSTALRLLRLTGLLPAPVKAELRRGGRYRHSSGYTYVWVDPEGPYAAMANAQGYAPEHRLVLARSLRRPLRPDEYVHHKDGDRGNNRRDNLQLRQAPSHGKGTRYCCLDCGSENVAPVEI